MGVLEPQLAVVRGLVRERTQQLGVSPKRGQEVFTTRRDRNSYGVVVNVRYDESRHRGQPTFYNAHSQATYVPSAIEWFIRQGQEINVKDGFRREWNKTLADGEHLMQHRARVVMSTLPPDQLPVRVADGNCREVATIGYKLTENDMKLKNRQLWKLKKKYWRAEFFFVVKLGPADSRFQIEGKNGILSSDHDSLEVEFIDPVAYKSPKLPRKPLDGR